MFSVANSHIAFSLCNEGKDRHLKDRVSCTQRWYRLTSLRCLTVLGTLVNEDDAIPWEQTHVQLGSECVMARPKQVQRGAAQEEMSWAHLAFPAPSPPTQAYRAQQPSEEWNLQGRV